jgi:hypothetical protein
MSRGHALLLAAALLGSAGRLAAQNAEQDIRTLHVRRDLTGSGPMHVDVTYGVGTLTLKPATGPVLYDVSMSYQADQSTPRVSYDASSRALDLGIKDGTFHNVNFDSTGFLNVQLPIDVPLDLSLEIGAAQATLNLGGLSVRRLMFKGGATQTTVNFGVPNPIPMESMTMEVGAAQFEAHGLANANAKNMTVGGGAGQVELWFDGDWTNDVTLRSKIVLGEMKIHVPANVRVVSTAKAILGAVTDQGNDTGKAKSDDHDMSDSSDMDMSDSSDDSDDDSAAVKARVDAAKMRAEAAKIHAEAAKVRADQEKVRAEAEKAELTQAPVHTLYITGSATVGSLEILHDAGTNGSH